MVKPIVNILHIYYYSLQEIWNPAFLSRSVLKYWLVSLGITGVYKAYFCYRLPIKEMNNDRDSHGDKDPTSAFIAV